MASVILASRFIDIILELKPLYKADQEFVEVDKVVSQYESVSGSLINRDKKSTVMGLGKWKNRQVWPLNWLKVVDHSNVLQKVSSCKLA